MIGALAAAGHPIERASRLVGVSHFGFYPWRTRPPSARSIRHAWLTDLITNIHIDSNGVYGAPRVRAELVHGHGITVGHNAVAMLMARAGLQGLPARRRHVRKPKLWTPVDLVDRQFGRAGPNKLWVTDITEHPTRPPR